MPRHHPLPILLSALLVGFAHTALAAPPARKALAPSPRIQVNDYQRRIDVNQINMFVTNVGSFAWDLTTGNAGLIYPRGSGKTAVFAGGLWIGGVVGGQVRVTVAEYSQEFGPGTIVDGFPDPNPHFVMKVVRWSGNPDDSAHVVRTPAELAADPDLDPLAHHSWSEYMADAAPYGAPWRLYRLPVTDTPAPGDSIDVPGPDVLGDQMLWAVYNDADATLHTNDAGASTPLGLEVQQTTYAFDRPDGLGSTVFMRFRVINKGPNQVDSAFVSIWSDTDIGAAADDLAGSDPAPGLGYAYNSGSDAIYGVSAPAVGYDFLHGPRYLASDSTSPRVPMTAFSRFINGTDPVAAAESYNYMNGRLPDGSDLIDPTTGQPTRFFFPGDPLTGMGWLDSAPADLRTLSSAGPIYLAPGDSVETVVALVIGQDLSPLASIARMRCFDLEVQRVVDGLPPPPSCSGPPVNCTRIAEYWNDQCAPGTQELTDAQLDTIATAVGTQATIFEWGDRAAFCATVGGGGDARARAKREFAALIANVAAGQAGIAPPVGDPIRLNPLTTISCPDLEAETISELIETAPPSPELYDAIYQNFAFAHRRPFEGVDWSGNPFFQGGAGYARDFFGSSLDPSTQPAAFGTVEVRFSHFYRQKAHRFLRLEQLDGLPPPQGRAYLYGGYQDVNFMCWDVTHGVQLDVAFVERAFTDAAGNLLPLDQQPATHNSSWGPDDSDIGGREYLFVYGLPYSPVPRPELAVDGGIASGIQPLLYVLWSRLRSAGDVIDDGDRFDFVWGLKPNPGVDQDLLVLEGQSLGDPAVVTAYERIADCLESINHGIGIGPTCQDVVAVPDPPSDTAPSLVELALEGVRPNPSAGDFDVAFTLPARGPGSLELIDVAGRRVIARDVGGLAAGRHVERLGDRRLPAGLYLVRLTHGGRALTTKAVLIR